MTGNGNVSSWCDIPFEFYYFKNQKKPITKSLLSDVLGTSVTSFQKLPSDERISWLIQNDAIEIVRCKVRQKKIPLSFDEVDETLISRLMKAMKKEEIVGYGRVIQDNDHSFLPLNIQPEERCPLTNLSFGSMIDLHSFVPHFTSDTYRTSRFKVSKSPEDFRVRFSHGKDQVTIAFRLTSGGNHSGNKSGILEEHYKFILKYNDIGYVVVSPSSSDSGQNHGSGKSGLNNGGRSGLKDERSLDGRNQSSDSFKRDNVLDVYLVLIRQPLLMALGPPGSDVRNPIKKSSALHSMTIESSVNFNRVLSLPADEVTVDASSQPGHISSIKYKETNGFLDPEVFAKSNVIKLTMARRSGRRDDGYIDPIQVVSALSTFAPNCPIFWSSVSMRGVPRIPDVTVSKVSKGDTFKANVSKGNNSKANVSKGESSKANVSKNSPPSSEVGSDWTPFTIPEKWPFPIKYAIYEPFSKSFWIADDLTFKKKKNAFKKILQDVMNVSEEEKKLIDEKGDPNVSMEEKVALLKRIKEDILCEVFNEMFRQLERGAILDTIEFLARHFDRMPWKSRPDSVSLLRSQRRSNCSDNVQTSSSSVHKMLMIRRVVITPGRMICCPPEPHLASRFLLEVDIDSLLKVTFRDENLSSYTVTTNTRGNWPTRGIGIIYAERVKAPIVNQLQLLSRSFGFLASGASQLRGHTLLLYAKDSKGRDCLQMQSKIGDLSNITNVAKYIARMGQSMSQAGARIEIPSDQVVDNFPDMIKFVTIQGHKRFNNWKGDVKMTYKFSDGCGMISPEVARMATKELCPNLKYCLSCFQVRRAGCKGILVVNMDIETTLLSNTDWMNRNRIQGAETSKTSNPGNSKTSNSGNSKTSNPGNSKTSNSGNSKTSNSGNSKTSNSREMMIKNPKDIQLVFRDSMKKFESNSQSLEVIKGSLVRPVHLNRSFIMVLDQLEVPSRVIMEQLMKYLNFLSNCFLHESSARSLLREYSSLNTALPGFDQLFTSPINILNEPFVRKTLDSVVKGLIADLKSKARIRLPFDAARHMIGVVDETGTLREGQVFVQYTKGKDWEAYDKMAASDGLTYGHGIAQNTDCVAQNTDCVAQNTDCINQNTDCINQNTDCINKNTNGLNQTTNGGQLEIPEREILTGTVMVTKAPTMVIGDVRKFEAIDVPALRHICDCIVFPSDKFATRPHPSEMAGSDLDGDEYVVIWYKPLLFEGPNRKPLDYISSAEAETKEITAEKIMKFFVKFMQNDNVGLIASAHLAKSDRDPDGTDERCLRLAEMYSIALDSPKTGESVPLDSTDYSSLYPDYMEKEAHKGTYISERVLGNIYRQVIY